MARADDTEAARRRRIENMSNAEKEQLRQRRERFKKLDPAEQERLRQLHRRLQADPKAEQLRRVMNGYCTWLKELPLDRQAELRALEPAQRIERIKQLREEEAGRPKREDIEGLFRWLEQYVSKNEARILESMPEPFREKMAELDSGRRRRWLTWMTWGRWQMGRSVKPRSATDDDLAELRSNLSDDARKRLESEPAEKQWQTVADWLRTALRHRMASRRFEAPMRPELQKELDDFFEHELSPEEQERLLNLPGEEMQRALRWAYLSRFRSSESPVGRSPFPPGRGRRSGPPGPPRNPPTHLKDGSRPGTFPRPPKTSPESRGPS